MLVKTEKETICLLCSTCCPVRVEMDNLGGTRPVYRKRGDVGICSRGGLVSQLVADGRRLNLARVQENGSWRELPLTEALARASSKLKAAGGSAAVLVDGNVGAEALLQAHQFCTKALGSENFVIYLPATDRGLLDGVAASGAKLISKENLSACDVVLCVGDPFATHPLIGRPIHEARLGARGNRLLVVDAFPNRTASFATDFVQIPPGTEHLLLAALVRALVPRRELPSQLGSKRPARLLAAAGVTRSQLDLLSEAIKGASKLAVVISLAEGRNAHPELVGALAGMLSAGKDGGILPLTIYGNARGAWRVAGAVNAKPVGELLKSGGEGRIKALLVAGLDLASALPARMLEKLSDNVGFIVLASSLPARTAGISQMVLPLGMWFEEEGTAIDEEGKERKILPLADPPSGALGVRELFEGLIREVTGAEPGKPDLKVAGTEPAVNLEEMLAQLSLGKSSEEGLVLVAKPGCIHFADGSLSGQMAWPHQMESGPTLSLGLEDATVLGVSPGQWVKVKGNGREVKAEVEVLAGLGQGWALLSAHFPEVRELFDWSIDENTGGLRAEPRQAQVQREA